MQIEKILNTLEKMAAHVNRPFYVNVERHNSTWVLMFTSLDVRVRCTVSDFMKDPKIVIDPFMEELIKSEMS